MGGGVAQESLFKCYAHTCNKSSWSLGVSQKRDGRVAGGGGGGGVWFPRPPGSTTTLDPP